MPWRQSPLPLRPRRFVLPASVSVGEHIAINGLEFFLLCEMFDVPGRRHP